jgi:fimbrial chaperone protein
MTTTKTRTIFLLLLGLGTLCLPGPGEAAQLKVSPIRVELGVDRPVEVVTLANPGKEPMLVQVRLRQWSHPTGQDVYADSRDVLVNPMVFELQPGEQQVVRVGLTKPMAAEKELSYRLFVQQLPNQGVGEARAVTTLLSLALPLFIAPRELLPPDLAWRVEPKSATEVAVQIENKGNLHAEISSIALNRQNGEQVASIDRRIYVLPGQRREVVVPGDNLNVAERLTLTAASKHGRIETALRVGTVAPVEEAFR